MKRVFSSLVLLCVVYLSVSAQIDITKIKNVDSIWMNYISTVEFTPINDKEGMPIVEIGGQLLMEFDDSYGDYMDYFYTIYHCDRNWNLTPNIERSMYLEGRSDIDVENYVASVSTNLSYYHYQFKFPNEDMQLRWSGNYMLVVYDSDGTIVISRRFYVVENVVQPDVDLRRPNSAGEYNSHQAMVLSVDVSKLNPRNPVADLYVYAWQNRLNEMGIEAVQGDYMTGSVLKFDVLKQFSFPGLKEYRFFDTRTVELAGLNVARIDLSNTEVIVTLEPEKDRHLKSNFTRQELNGSFYIDNNDRKNGNPDFTSEYPKVNFTLKVDYEIQDDVYILGEFNDYKASPKFRMNYVPEHNSYMLEVPLKQGYYNYLFASENQDGSLDLERYEGSSYETENDYYFFIYHTPQEQFYDRIVGFFKINFRGL